MGRPGITINAAVLASAIRINARVEADVRAVIVGQNGSGFIFEQLSAGSGLLFWFKIGIRLEMQLLESVGRIGSGATTMQGKVQGKLKSLKFGVVPREGFEPSTN